MTTILFIFSGDLLIFFSTNLCKADARLNLAYKVTEPPLNIFNPAVVAVKTAVRRNYDEPLPEDPEFHFYITNRLKITKFTKVIKETEPLGDDVDAENFEDTVPDDDVAPPQIT